MGLTFDEEDLFRVCPTCGNKAVERDWAGRDQCLCCNYECYWNDEIGIIFEEE